MQTIPLAVEVPSHPLHEADPFLERPKRMGAAAGRRRRPWQDGQRLGWKTWLLIDGTALILFLTAIVVWPPLSACRSKAYHVGLYAGDTVEKCTRRGVAERIERADQRIKMLVRGSGR